MQKELEQLRSEFRKYNNENTPTSSIPYFEKETTNHRNKQSGQKEGHKGMSRKKPVIDRTVKLILECLLAAMQK